MYITLFKKTHYSDNKLLELYIHFYIDTLHNTFREMNLFDGTDYFIKSFTYNKQLLQVNVALITNKAQKNQSKVSTQEPNFTPQAINHNVSKIELAERVKLSYSQQEIKRALEAIHEQSWQTFDQFDHYLPSGSTKQLFTIEEHSQPVNIHLLAAKLDKDYREKHPTHVALFWHIFQTLQYELAANLNRVYGCIITRDNSRYDGGHTLEALELVFLKDANIQDRADSIIKIYHQLLDDGMIESMVAFIQTDFHNLPLGGINESELYDTLKLVLGETGWRSLVTKKNIELVLAHTDLVFSDFSEEIILNLSIKR